MRSRRERQLNLGGGPLAGGLGSKPLEMSWPDYLVLLLHLGAEIEHALMVQYLYAAYSLGGEEVGEKHRPLVQRWQAGMLTVAREEMGHLLTVQNVLCLLGGPLSFEREDYPWQSPFYPYPFQLAPFSLDTLAHFIYAEMPPSGGMPKDAARWELEVYEAVRARIEKEEAHPHHVAELYGLILELLGDPERIPDAAFRRGTYSAQASWDEWGRGYGGGPKAPPANGQGPAEGPGRVIVARMATRTEALAALADVAGQGEAPQLRKKRGDDAKEPSHFGRFAQIYREMAPLDGRFTPVRPVPVNPTTAGSRAAAPGATFIESESSRAWASLFNLRYRMLLTYLSHSYRLSRAVSTERPGVRGATLHRVFAEMYNLKTIAGLLVRLPLASDAKDPRRAGPPFELPYTLDLPADETDCWRLHLDLLGSSERICLDLEGGAPPEGKAYLASLRDLDRQSRSAIGEILVAHGGARRH